MAKNIIMCSDGTGNRGGKSHGTNVWRLFKALDRTPASKQVAFYDDGVGTEDFKLVRALGGAVGWGLSRNIRELYTFLVRNYETGDRIYLFGFSRGAFTVRSLGGLINRCGVVDRSNGNDEWIDERVKDAYDHYRRAHSKPSYQAADEFKCKFGVADSNGCHDVPIKFVGVWDTVDAVGLPFDELTEALDKVFRVKFHDRGPPQNVEYAYHAIAIDDERHTFHPVMWEPPSNGTTTTKVLEQVWFAGVHSNVGGGYPKDGLALVSLDWMMEKLEALPNGERLVFLQAYRDEIRDQASPYDKLYDSRAGVGAYYRYKPRAVGEICKEAGIGRPKIHESVVKRIKASTGGYAPSNLPLKFDEINTNSSTAHKRKTSQTTLDVLDDYKWCRRVLYYVFVLSTLFYLVVANNLADITVVDCTAEVCSLGAVAGLVYWIVPDMLDSTVAALDAHRGWLYSFVVVFALLLIGHSRLKRKTNYTALGAWRTDYPWGTSAAAPPDGATCPPDGATWLSRLANRIRTNRLALWLHRMFERYVGYLTLIVPAALLLWWFSLWVWEVFGSADDKVVACDSPPSAAVLLSPGESKQFNFDTRSVYQRAPIVLEKGKSYQLGVVALSDSDSCDKHNSGDWYDRTLHAGPDGLNEESETNVFMRATEHWRRAPDKDWMVLLGSIGSPTAKPFVIGSGGPVTAPRSGVLYVYVNDLLCPICPTGMDRFYSNNRGKARITVSRCNGDDCMSRAGKRRGNGKAAWELRKLRAETEIAEHQLAEMPM